MRRLADRCCPGRPPGSSLSARTLPPTSSSSTGASTRSIPRGRGSKPSRSTAMRIVGVGVGGRHPRADAVRHPRRSIWRAASRCPVSTTRTSTSTAPARCSSASTCSTFTSRRRSPIAFAKAAGRLPKGSWITRGDWGAYEQWKAGSSGCDRVHAGARCAGGTVHAVARSDRCGDARSSGVREPVRSQHVPREQPGARSSRASRADAGSGRRRDRQGRAGPAHRDPERVRRRSRAQGRFRRSRSSSGSCRCAPS